MAKIRKKMGGMKLNLRIGKDNPGDTEPKQVRARIRKVYKNLIP
jgi:hypothetical protein